MSHAVVLIPGFLGFDKVGNFAYFAQRVVDALSGALAALETPMPVLPVSTLGIASLADRQRMLLQTLAGIEADHLHLIGHSTGGVDAELLTRTQPTATSRLDLWTTVRPRIRTVTTIAAPHLGTGLTECAAATLIRTGHPVIEGLRQAADFLATAGLHDLSERVQFARGALSTSGGVDFVRRFLQDHVLLEDLTPTKMWKRYAENPQDKELDVQRSYYVTVTPPDDGESNMDALFELLAGTIEGVPYVEGDGAPRVLLDSNLIRCAHAEVFTEGPPRPPLDVWTNDGVVNSCRQLLPGASSDLCGVVVGDHGDVLGHYRRVDTLTGQVLSPGLLLSGAHFGDAAFTALYTDVARTIQLNTPLTDHSYAPGGRAAS